MIHQSKKQKISHFVCKICDIKIPIGACGKHREDTGHKDFQEIGEEYD